MLVHNFKGVVDLKVCTRGVDIQGTAGITPTLGEANKN